MEVLPETGNIMWHYSFNWRAQAGRFRQRRNASEVARGKIKALAKDDTEGSFNE